MKKLTILFSIMLFGLIGSTQNDTIVFFESETIDKTFVTITKESKWRTIDSILFDEIQDSTLWHPSKWRRKDSLYHNPRAYVIIEVQKRMNDQGIRQRRSRRIKYVTRTVNIRSIR